MPRRRIPRPSYHRGQQRWYVTLDGKEHYLHRGKLAWTKEPPDDIQAEYNRVLAAWHSARASQPEPVTADPTIDELWLGYLAAVEGGAKYHKHGRPTSEVELIRSACRVCARLFGETRAAEFGPKRLRTVRQAFVDAGWTRETVNKATHRVKRMFRWAVAEELLPEAIHRALQTLPDLTVAEHPTGDRKVKDVADAVLAATVRRLRPNLAAMVRAHRLIGCRAQEIAVARTCDFDLAADAATPAPDRCWLFTPSESKTGESYWVGPRAQAVLRPLLRPDDPTAWLFPTRQRGRGCWTTASYRRAIARAVAAINVRIARVNSYREASGRRPLTPLPHWSPLQIRHAAGEEARQKHPARLEATQARLRHKEMQVSQKYAHDLSELGKDVARRLG